VHHRQGVSAARAREAARKGASWSARRAARGRTAPREAGRLSVSGPKLTSCTSSRRFCGRLGQQGATAASRRSPARGKILNVQKARSTRSSRTRNPDDHYGHPARVWAEDFNLDDARYHKIIIMTDPTWMAPTSAPLLSRLLQGDEVLIDAGYINIAQPPLYRWPKARKSSTPTTKGARRLRSGSRTASRSEHGNAMIQRYKGLGEMNPDHLRNPRWIRRAAPPKVTMEDAFEASQLSKR